MPKGPDVPPRVLALIAIAALLGIVLVLDPFGGADEPITSPTPPPAEEPAGDADPRAGGDAEAQINAALERAFVTFDPAACSEAFTERALEQLTLSNEDPVARCEENAEDEANARSIEVSELEIRGASASAVVEPTGGSNAGAVYTMQLVDQDGWHIDRITAMRIVDREEFLDNALAVTADDGSLTGRQRTCIAGYVRDQVSNAALENTYVEGDISWVSDAVRACVGTGTGAPQAGGGAGGGGSGGSDPQERYLDCVEEADTQEQIRACKDEVYGG